MFKKLRRWLTFESYINEIKAISGNDKFYIIGIRQEAKVLPVFYRNTFMCKLIDYLKLGYPKMMAMGRASEDINSQIWSHNND